MMASVKDFVSHVRGEDRGFFARTFLPDRSGFARRVGTGSADLARRVGTGSADLAKRIGPKKVAIGAVAIAGVIAGSVVLIRFLRSRADDEANDGEPTEGHPRSRRLNTRKRSKAVNAYMSSRQ